MPFSSRVFRRPRPITSREESSASDAVSPPETPLSRAEQEAILGRPLANGLTFEQYRVQRDGGVHSPGGAFRFDLADADE
jgi:hypothetical protein